MGVATWESSIVGYGSGHRVPEELDDWLVVWLPFFTFPIYWVSVLIPTDFRQIFFGGVAQPADDMWPPNSHFHMTIDVQKLLNCHYYQNLL